MRLLVAKKIMLSGAVILLLRRVQEIDVWTKLNSRVNYDCGGSVCIEWKRLYLVFLVEM